MAQDTARRATRAPGVPWLRRRDVILGGVGAAALSGSFGLAQEATGGGAETIDYDAVVARAQALAAKGHSDSRQDLTAPFADLGYDAYRAIRFDPARRLWRNENRGFEIDLLPPGSVFRDAVRVFVVEDGLAREATFDPTALIFDPSRFTPPPDLGPSAWSHAWTGFRVRFPINRPDLLDEFAVFQGASYFRAVARGQTYGLSARALALRTGLAEGEEFPRFTDFWLHRPETEANALTVHALLESPSATGAFEFVLRPGGETLFDVRCAVFARTDMTELGVAPLTSMYFFGPKDRGRFDDYRDAAHDSAGLQMLTGRGERLWRPLNNPQMLQISTFQDRNPQGFALVQRQRGFAYYQDAEARYDLRPSAAVTPRGEWGAGGVRLIEIPTDSEFNDNIVAFWRPEAALAAGARLDLEYRIVWAALAPDAADMARVVGTRIGQYVNDRTRLSVIVDFDLGEQTPAGLSAVASVSAGAIEHVGLKPLPGGVLLRAAIRFAPPESGDAEFRVMLLDGSGAQASETWLYRWSPP